MSTDLANVSRAYDEWRVVVNDALDAVSTSLHNNDLQKARTYMYEVANRSKAMTVKFDDAVVQMETP